MLLLQCKSHLKRSLELHKIFQSMLYWSYRHTKYLFLDHD
nr:MAG TPA: hypothetical protein [Caudoviricetes sp.]